MRGTLFSKLLFATIFLLICIQTVNGSALVVNSQDWRDVYLGLHYANLKEFTEIYFLTSFTDAEVVASLIGDQKNQQVVIIESGDEPYIREYARFLELKGFNSLRSITSDDPYFLQFDLANELSTNKYVVVSGKHGYDAISVAPYAYSKNHWVFFVDSTEYSEVKSFLEERSEETLLYGKLGRKVLAEFSELDAEVINNGNRFLDNQELSLRIMPKGERKLVLISSGSLIESELMSGKEGTCPVVLYSNAQDITEFLLSNDVKLTQINGMSLAAGERIREVSNKEIGVLVKYAMTYRGIADLPGLRALRIFPVPTPEAKLEIDSIHYDKERETLFVKYTNKGNAQAFFSSRVSVVSSSIGEVEALLDDYVHSLHPAESFLAGYPVNVTLNNEEDYTAYIHCLYGEELTGMNKYVTQEGRELPPYKIGIDFVKLVDYSKAEVEAVDFVVADYSFVVKVKNVGEKTAYVDTEIFNFEVEGVNHTFSYDNKPGFAGAKKIAPGESKLLVIETDLLETDFEDNEEVSLALYSGQKKEWMIEKTVVSAPVHLSFEKVMVTGFMSFISSWWWLIIGVFVLIVIFLIKRKKEKEREEVRTVLEERSENLFNFLGKR
ncbi:hypothetical protein K8R43_03445 [archaeon]|nr:hypothetical protein [archaeon]